MRNRGVSIAGQETVVARLTQERDEALLRETANAEILRLIAKSSGDLELLFRTILENATRICNANFGTLFRFDGENILPVAQFNTPTTLLKAQTRRGPFKPTPGTAMEHVLRTKQVSHSADKVTEPVPGFFAEHGGARSQVAVPMLKDDLLIGVIVIYHQDVRPFTDKQIELLQNFASQAVIAIENARLLNELRQSLEQQTATSDVLQIISSSPGDLAPVLQAIVESACQLCESDDATVALKDGHDLVFKAQHGSIPIVWDRIPINRQMVTGRAVIDGQPVHVRDLYGPEGEGFPDAREFARQTDVRTVLSVPLLREGESIGVITLRRTEVEPFSDKQINLLETFADQAVIAIENARLFDEVQFKTCDLEESLQFQTASAEVLKVISQSPDTLQPVFDVVVKTARELCRAQAATIFTLREAKFHVAAFAGVQTEVLQHMKDHPISLEQRGSALARSAREKRTVHIPNTAEDPEFAEESIIGMGQPRSTLTVPLARDGEVIGGITLRQSDLRPFTTRQIEAIETFADQAVIAISNVGLFDKVQARTQELRDRTVELERSYDLVRQQASQLEAQSQELLKLNQQLEQRVADQVGEIERMGRLRRFLPPQVADLIVASGSEKQLESHRREITALFCDLRGFTGFSEASAPEDVMALLRDYHAAIGEIIIKYSGTLERYAGDGVMVVFNDPVPVDNPALRAVLMALETREAMGALMEKWRQLGHDVGFGIGIAHGFATLGTIGFEGRFDYAAIGTVSNVASRLCDEAKPGQILISPRVFTAVKDAVTVEPVGELTLKGIGRPLAAYNVLGAKPAN